MARAIQSCIKVKGTLQAMRPLHVGGRGKDANVDLALATNGQGQVYIPGTSLAGALRHWMEGAFGKDLSRQLWGYQKTRQDQSSDDSSKQYEYASFVLIEDAVIQLPTGAVMKAHHMEVRDGVGIDRHLGTAADRFQYSRAIIPRNATFPLELTVELVDKIDTAQVKHALSALIDALKRGQIRLGAAKTRGLGWVQLQKEGFEANEQRFQTRNDILSILQGKIEPYSLQAGISPTNRLTLKIDWQAMGPLMVKADQSGVAIDILPLMGQVGDQQLAFVLPGSSIKGALRSQAERILRTVLNQPLSPQKTLAEQIDLPLIETLFGKAADVVPMNGKELLPGLGALLIEDCYSQQSAEEGIRIEAWQDVISATQSEVQTKLAAANLKTTQQAFHVAVDRWTGGAADQFLYTNLEPFDLNWEPIQLTLNFDRIPESEYLPIVTLLLFLLRDLSDRRIPLGYGVNRGMGTVKVKQVEFKLEGRLENEAIAQLKEKTLEAGTIQNLNKDFLEELSQNWSEWIDSQTSANEHSVEKVTQ